MALMRILTFAITAATLVAWAFAQLMAEVDPQEVRLLEELRQRRLYRLAVAHCESHLGQSELTAQQRAWWTAELVRVWAEAAMEAGPEEREAAWQRARQTASDYLDRHADHTASVWVRLQRALVETAYGNYLRQTAETARQQVEQRSQAALDALREAARQLEQLEQWLDRVIPTAPALVSDDQLSHDQLFALRNQVRLVRAEVLQYQAQCYPPGEDRVGLLAQSLDVLRNALTQLPSDDLLAWRARLDQVISHRLLGDLQEADQNLAQLLGNDVPEEIKVQAAAEKLRLLVAQGRWQAAWDEVARSEFRQKQYADWDLAALEVLVALWQQGAPVPPGVGNSWREQAVAWMKQIEARHGPYWGRRAEALTLQTASQAGAIGDVELLRRRADDLFLRGQLSEALAAYDAAATAARQAHAAEEEWLARGRAARLAEQLGNRLDAAQRWRQAAMSLPTHPQAATAHLESIRLAAQAVRDGTLDNPSYQEWLAEHLRHWPQGPAADRVRLILAGRLLAEHQWDEATRLCAEVESAEQQVQACQIARAAWLAKLEDAAPAAHPQILDQATAYFGRWQSSSAATAASNEAQLALSELVLRFAPHRASQIEQQLERMDGRQLSTEQAARLGALRFLALAFQPGRGGEAQTVLSQLPRDVPDLYRELARQVGDYLTTCPANDAAAVAQLQLQVLDRWQPGDALQERWQWTRLKAEALLALGKAGDALAEAASLTKAHPSDGWVQVEYARLVEKAAPQVGWQQALQRWRLVAAATVPRSDVWYEAKLAVARAQEALGQRDDAVKLLRYVLLTAPPPPGSHWDRLYRDSLTAWQR